MIDRITANSKILGGKPIIQGTRLSVEFILDLLAGADLCVCPGLAESHRADTQVCPYFRLSNFFKRDQKVFQTSRLQQQEKKRAQR